MAFDKNLEKTSTGMNRPLNAGHLGLFGASLIWGFAFVAQRQGMEHMQPLTFNGIRFLLGTLSLLPLLWFRRGVFRPFTNVKSALIMGLLAGIPLFFAAFFQQLGLKYTTAGNAGFITSLYIVFVPLLSIRSKNRSTMQTWLGVILALVGLYFLSVYPGTSMQAGDLLVLTSALFWALHLIILSYLSPKYDFRLLAISQYLFTGVISLLAGLAFGEPLNPTNVGDAWIPLLYAGVASVGIGYTLQVVGQRNVRADHAALILSLEATFAAFGGWLILEEKLSLVALFGCLLMLCGVIISQLRLKFPGIKA
jgi:drug/metabolite transporter (DMT)-like permease